MAGYSGKMHFQVQPIFFINMVTDQAAAKPIIVTISEQQAAD
jgi:hypothetical protein